MFKNMGGNIPGGNYPGGSLLGGNFPGGNCPSGSFPDTVSFPKLLISLTELKTFLYLITYLFLFLN